LVRDADVDVGMEIDRVIELHYALARVQNLDAKVDRFVDLVARSIGPSRGLKRHSPP
jgi:hypothetical protein